MPRLIHRRSRVAAITNDSSAATTRLAVEANTVDPESTSNALQPANVPDEMEVSGGNKRTYRNASRSQPKQRSLTTSTDAVTKNGSSSASVSNRSNTRAETQRSKPSRRATDRSDDSESYASDSDSSSSAVEDKDAAADLSDFTSTSSSGIDNDGELHDEEDQSTNKADDNQQDIADMGKQVTYARFAPVRSSAAVPGIDRQMKAIQPDTRRPPSTSKLQRAAGREIIYVRVPHSTSADAQRKLHRKLRLEYPGTLIVLDDSPTKTPFADRTSFSLLWQRIQDGRVDCIWIPRASHISKSKEAFQMFEWMCDEYRVPILILPALEVVIKTTRTNI